MNQYLVRVGLLGDVAQFMPSDGAEYARGTRVICRTERGLEVGEVLNRRANGGAPQGRILRRVTVEDDLLVARLEKHKDAGMQACSQLLATRGINAVLMDAELLFDGRSLCLYFFGEVPDGLDELTQELADVYEERVQIRKFVETLTAGCGPGCGTDEAEGGACGTSGGCQTCVIATACKTSVRRA